MVQQTEFKLSAHKRGFHLVTSAIEQHLPELPETGILHLFIKHTSAGITINENCDPSVRIDFESIFNKLVPENQSYYTHNDEGPDDMPAHIKTAITGYSITLPITGHKLNLGTWQGIYLCEFRNNASARSVVATVYG